MHQIINGKYDELAKDFANVGIDLVFDGNLTLPEDSELLIDNAISKAQAAAKEKNMMAIGDDSGIFIEALDYFPGVHSRRWAGAEADDSFRNQKILKMMNTITDRRVYLISRFGLVDEDGNVLGRFSVKNPFKIAYSERGEYGFAYDRILELEYDEDNLKLKNKKQLEDAFRFIQEFKYIPTVAELPQDVKNGWNQRGFLLAKDVQQTLKKKGIL